MYIFKFSKVSFIPKLISKIRSNYSLHQDDLCTVWFSFCDFSQILTPVSVPYPYLYMY
ncbi:hypothetical protein HanIR_Chr15g0731121 [Helianthus annuus]|nr:hypothetical protein HanIR_Chr15g0731121 [Helianthus annuus]